MEAICKFCKKREYLPRYNIFRCSQAKTSENEYGSFQQGACCIHDDTQLKDLFEPIDDNELKEKELLEYVERMEKKNSELRQQISDIKKKVGFD